MTRRGFTLVELLVATGIFVIGFAAVFSLFLSGMRFRKLADDTTLTATLAASVLTEMYLDSGAEGPTANPAGGPVTPDQYIGNGRCSETSVPVDQAEPPPPNGMDTQLFPYAGIPGAFYRVDQCTDVLKGQDAFATAINAEILALCPGGGGVSTYGELNRRIRIFTPSQLLAIPAANQATQFEDELVRHGIAMSYRAVIIRQPHWMFK